MMNSDKKTMNINDWKILAKHLNNELSDEEIKGLENRAGDDEMQNLIRQTRVSLENIDQHLISKKFDIEKAWLNVEQKIDSENNIVKNPNQNNVRRISFLSRIAAIALILLTVGTIAWLTLIKSKVETIVFATSPTDISHPTVTLPDGTKVTLNHNTKITYPSNFNENTRDVSLSGEAFFDVAHDKLKPFVIKTDKAMVRVLGTSFNVSAYNEATLVNVIVKTGKVQLSKLIQNDNRQLNPILLLPGDQGIYNKHTDQLFKMPKLCTNGLSWITSELKFENTTLSEVLKTIQNVYAVKISIPDSIVSSQKLTAQFEQQNIGYVLNVIGMTLNLKINKVDNGKYEITK